MGPEGTKFLLAKLKLVFSSGPEIFLIFIYYKIN